MALCPHLKLLKEDGMAKLGLRVTLDSDQVQWRDVWMLVGQRVEFYLFRQRRGENLIFTPQVLHTEKKIWFNFEATFLMNVHVNKEHWFLLSLPSSNKQVCSTQRSLLISEITVLIRRKQNFLVNTKTPEQHIVETSFLHHRDPSQSRWSD